MTVPNLTLDELGRLAAGLADPTYDCDCAPPGVYAPMLPGGDAAHCFVQSCGECQKYDSDNDAAQVVADALGLVVRVRYDDEHREYFRPFLARPGSDDDADFYCVGADEFGCNPHSEVRIDPEPVPPEVLANTRAGLLRLEGELSTP